MIFSPSDKQRKVPHPQVVVLNRSDSRVPRNLVFDARLVELFVMRSAGVDDVPPRVDRDCRHTSRKLWCRDS
jgi:carbonic anhydrase